MPLPSHSERAEREYLEGLRYEDKFPDEGEVSGMGNIERYEALPKPVREQMENRFMWAASTGGHPDATLEGAVATIVDPLLGQLEGAVDALQEFIAAVAAPTGRLRLEEHAEGDVLHAAVKEARAKYAALGGR